MRFWIISMAHDFAHSTLSLRLSVSPVPRSISTVGKNYFKLAAYLILMIILSLIVYTNSSTAHHWQPKLKLYRDRILTYYQAFTKFAPRSRVLVSDIGLSTRRRRRPIPFLYLLLCLELELTITRLYVCPSSLPLPLPRPPTLQRST